MRAVPGLGSDDDPPAVDLVAEVEAADVSVASLCLSLDERLDLTSRHQLGYLDIYRHYELWDQFLFPCDPNLGVPPRDNFQLARVSPQDARYVSKSPENKVAGDALFHFGGFLKKEWRTNDILWGRLDAAENIVRMLSKRAGFSEEEIDQHIQAAQLEVVEDDLPEALPHYRHYLETKYATGEEGLGDVPMADRADVLTRAADVVRNMLGGVAKARAGTLRGPIYTWIGAALGWILMILRWPVQAIWGADPWWKRVASLAVLFIGAWTVATFVLALLNVIDGTSNLWALIGLGAAVYISWSVLLFAFARRKIPLLVLMAVLVAAIVYVAATAENLCVRLDYVSAPLSPRRAPEPSRAAPEALVEVLAAQAVDLRRARAGLLDHPGLAQDAEVMGEGRLRDRHRELAAAPLAAATVGEVADDLEPDGVGERMQDLGQLQGLRGRMVEGAGHRGSDCTTIVG